MLITVPSFHSNRKAYSEWGCAPQGNPPCVDTRRKNLIWNNMDGYSSLPADLLDLTSRYLFACNLKSFLLPLPFCDEAILDRKALLAKVLSNSSSLSKTQLWETVLAFKPESRTIASSNSTFDRIYESTLAGKQKLRKPRKLPTPPTATRTTLRTSTTALSDKLTLELSSMYHPNQIASHLDSAIRGISKPNTVGFTMIIAAECPNSSTDEESDQKLIPIAGGSVEIIDPEEHCLRCVWCDPRLTNKDECEFGKVLILRLLGHLFDYGYPGTTSNNRLKHTSVLNIHGILFPSSIYTFMINGLRFGKHFETKDNGGSHEDTSTNFCRCQRLMESEDAELFWGISESRLRNTFNNIKSQILLLPSEQTLATLQTILTPFT